MDLITNLNNPAERRKQVRLKVRPDLQVYEQKYEGKTFHVVKGMPDSESESETDD